MHEIAEKEKISHITDSNAKGHKKNIVLKKLPEKTVPIIENNPDLEYEFALHQKVKDMQHLPKNDKKKFKEKQN